MLLKKPLSRGAENFFDVVFAWSVVFSISLTIIVGGVFLYFWLGDRAFWMLVGSLPFLSGAFAGVTLYLHKRAVKVQEVINRLER